MTLAAATLSSARTGRGSDDWQTPGVVLDRVRRYAGGPIGLDPCTSPDNPTDADRYYTIADNALTLTWHPVGLTFCNWPYSQSAKWAAKVVEESQRGLAIIVLCAARPDTRWWRALWSVADVVGFWNGRITFVGAPSPAPFPSALVGINCSPRRFRAAFGDVATVVTP